MRNATGNVTSRELTLDFMDERAWNSIGKDTG